MKFPVYGGENEEVEQDIRAVNICTIILSHSNYSDVYTLCILEYISIISTNVHFVQHLDTQTSVHFCIHA